MSETKKPGLLERLDALERGFDQLNEASAARVAQLGSQIRGSLGNVVEVLTAIIKLKGEDFDKAVEVEVERARSERAKENLARAQAMLQNLVDTGAYVKSEIVTEDSLIVAREFDKSGDLLGLGRSQVEFKQFNTEVQAFLLGKHPGTLWEGPDGQLEVMEIYKPNPTPPAAEVPAPEVKASEAVVDAQVVTEEKE